jgi:DNA-binding NarL/FixJ family response regulator
VQRHVENAYAKLGVRNRAGATLKAARLGLVSQGGPMEGVG